MTLAIRLADEIKKGSRKRLPFCFVFRQTRFALQRLVAFFLGADSDGLLDGGDEQFAVTDLAGVGGLGDRIQAGLDILVGDNQLKLDLGQKVHGVFAAPVNLGVAFLPAESLDFRHGHAFHANFGQCVPDFIQLERFNNCFDFFHNKSLNFHAS